MTDEKATPDTIARQMDAIQTEMRGLLDVLVEVRALRGEIGSFRNEMRLQTAMLIKIVNDCDRVSRRAAVGSTR